MRIPLIKVKDTGYMDGSTRTHIVGTDSHDTLYVDDSTGGLMYLNLQCCESTKRHCGRSTYEFVSDKANEISYEREVAFVSIETFLKIIGGQAGIGKKSPLKAEYDQACKAVLDILDAAYEVKRRDQQEFFAKLMDHLKGRDE